MRMAASDGGQSHEQQFGQGQLVVVHLWGFFTWTFDFFSGILCCER